MSRNTVTAGVACALLAAGVLSAAPASAATASSAYAISATGLVKIPKTPSVSGAGTESLASVALPESGPALLRARALHAEAGPARAGSSVAGLALDLGLLPKAPVELAKVADLTAEVITADCKEGKGSVSIAKLRLGDRAIKLDQVPPNTTVPLAPLLEIVVNKQVKADDGTLTVTAVSAKILGQTQTLDIASATCGKGDGGGGGSTTKPTETKPTDKPDGNGKAPRPTPKPAHLDVTG